MSTILLEPIRIDNQVMGVLCVQRVRDTMKEHLDVGCSEPLGDEISISDGDASDEKKKISPEPGRNPFIEIPRIIARNAE